jgi:hypothetical protein
MKISSTVTGNSHFDVAFAQTVPLVSKTKAGCYLSLREKQDAEKLAACQCSLTSGAVLAKRLQLVCFSFKEIMSPVEYFFEGLYQYFLDMRKGF